MQKSDTQNRIAKLPRNVFFLGFVSLFTDFSSEVAIRTLPLFLANVLGVKTSIIGLIEGVAESTATLMRLFSGWLSDKIKERKILVTIGYGLSTFVKPLLYFASSWSHVLVIRFLDRTGKGIRTSPRDALIADSSSEEERGKSFGFNKAMDPLGAVLGLASAALIVYFSQGGALSLTRFTYQNLVLLAVIPALISLSALSFVKEVKQTGWKTTKTSSLHKPQLSSNFKFYLFVLVLFTLGNSSDAFLMLRAQNLGIGIVEIFAILAAFNLVSSLVSYPAGKLSDKIGRKSLISAGWLVYSGVYLGFALATSRFHIWLLYMIYGIYEGVTAGVERALVADMMPAEMRGTAYGFYNTAIGIAALPSSFIAGILWQSFSPASPFIFGSALALLALIAFTFVKVEKKNSL